MLSFFLIVNAYLKARVAEIKNITFDVDVLVFYKVGSEAPLALHGNNGLSDRRWVSTFDFSIPLYIPGINSITCM